MILKYDEYEGFHYPYFIPSTWFNISNVCCASPFSELSGYVERKPFSWAMASFLFPPKADLMALSNSSSSGRSTGPLDLPP